MANWRLKIDLSSVWPTEDPKLITAEIARQLDALDLSFDETNAELAKDLAREFRELGEQEDPDVEDFDDLMQSLYDWADSRVDRREKLCWVATVA